LLILDYCILETKKVKEKRKNTVLYWITIMNTGLLDC